MSAALLSVLLAGQTLIAGELGAAAASSPRPVDCEAGENARGELWRRSRGGGRGRYCDLLGRGYARLLRNPREALEAALAAQSMAPGESTPLVLEGRARLGLGDALGAWHAFEGLGARPSASLQSPEALHDFALAALLAGRLAEAEQAYQRLVPRASLLTDTARRQRVYLEAAILVMRRNAEGVKEAVGLLTEARRSVTLPGFAPVLTAALALTLDRSGKTERARALAAELEGPRGILLWTRDGQTPSMDKATTLQARAVLPPGEIEALAAMASERDDPDQSLAFWRAYLDKVKTGPWIRHAQSKVSALLTGRAKASRR